MQVEGQIMLTVQTQDILLKISECVNLIRRITLADCLIPPPPCDRDSMIEQLVSSRG